MAMHAWAALGNDYCTFCFSGYLAFFNPLAILVVILLIPAWDLKTRPWWRFLSAAVTGSLLALIGYGNFEDFYDSKNFSEVLDFFFKLPLPWLRNGRLTFGDTLLWQVLANKFGLTFEQVRLEVLPMLIPAVLALAIFAATLIAVFILVRLPFIKKRQISFASLLLLVVLTAGIFLSPTPWLGGGFYTYDCRPGIVNEIEEAGQQLRELIPAGSSIYWRTNRMPIIMLTYLDSPNLFPPQLNGSYSFLNGGDSQQLARYGFWNQELSDQWLAQADYAFINAPSTAEMLEKIDELHYQPLAFLTRPFQCGTEQTTYLLFKK
jgi:hypothetical protein